MPTGLKTGRHAGQSPILARLPIENYLTGKVDPFPYSSPESTFDGTTGGVTTGMLGNGPDPTVPGFGGAGNCVFRGFQVTNMRNSWLTGETKPGDLSVWPSTVENLEAYFIFQGAPAFAVWCSQNGYQPTDPGAPVAYFTWCQDSGFDNGCDIGVALLYFQTHPIGNMPLLKRFAGVPTNGQFFQGGIGAFGVFYDGILVSQEMMNDSEQDPPQPWDQTATDWIGAHCAPVIFRSPAVAGYDTWDMIQPGDWPNWRVIREEGAVLLTGEIALAPDGTYHGLAVDDLDSDIATLAKEYPVGTPEQRRELVLSTVNRAPSIGTLLKLAEEMVEDAAKVIATAEGGNVAGAVVEAIADAKKIVEELEGVTSAEPQARVDARIDEAKKLVFTDEPAPARRARPAGPVEQTQPDWATGVVAPRDAQGRPRDVPWGGA